MDVVSGAADVGMIRTDLYEAEVASGVYPVRPFGRLVSTRELKHVVTKSGGSNRELKCRIGNAQRLGS